jgi:hypothetical protein
VRTLSRRVLRALAIAVLCLPLGVLPASAGAPNPGQTLLPPPPDFYTCTVNGAGTVCHAHREETYGPEETGIWCDNPDGPFEIWDQGGRVADFTRWYNRDGLVVGRLIINAFHDTHLSNPLSGAIVEYTQRDRDMERFAIPGDLDSGTLYSENKLVAVVPGAGAVLVESGRFVATGDEVLQLTGRRDLSDFFAGDPAALDNLCSALAG